MLPFIGTDDKDDKESMEILGELENIDDEADSHGLSFVKIDDDQVAKEYGIDDLPSLVYFEYKIPNVYTGTSWVTNPVFSGTM